MESIDDELTPEAEEQPRMEGQKDTRPIHGVEFVPIADLPLLGFGARFAELARDGFPGQAVIWARNR